MAENIMRKIRIEKVTLNMGVGEAGDELKRGEEILKKITAEKPIQTKCKIKQPTWGIREGLPIGIKVTLRKQKAYDFLETALQAKEKTLSKKSFDKQGNFGFGIREYIDLPTVKYDPRLGIKGLDVLVTLERPGFRVKKRKIQKKKLGREHLISREQSMQFMRETFGVEIV
jgi:large subunit ribosomal protein L5